jgi:hypothetical protein
MREVIQIISAPGPGDPHAASALLPLVYQELRKLGAQRTPANVVRPWRSAHKT